MKKAEEIYDKECRYGWYDYNPILEQFGNIIIKVDDDYYQGDSRVFYEKDGKYGFLIFGFGSCSGCDALQACENIDEVQNLMDSMQNSVKWFESLDEIKNYFKEKDWSLEWSYNSKNTKDFIYKVLNY